MSAAALEFKDITFSYLGGAPVLDRVCWQVPAGAFALLVGDTGSGKSTLLSLAKPEVARVGDLRGEVLVAGEDVRALPAARSAAEVGYVFQSPENQIVCDTVWHELAFGLENLGTPVDEMRRRIAETSYFFGIDEWARAETSTLSGGRKQLVALASVLAMRPSLLLLDEPTAQLDPIAERSFLHALFRVNRELGCTVVVATHAPRAMLDYATCAYRIEGGGVSEVADLRELADRPSLGLPEGGAVRTGARGNATAVRVDGAWFRYDRDDPWVLRGLDLAVGRGSVMALVGGNGCGKSTLLSAMARTCRLHRGRVCGEVARQALLPQDPRALLVADRVEDELMEWSRPAGYGSAAFADMLERLGISALAGCHPLDLSGGQQQLVALAKVALAAPDLLLLDEPTKGLDLASRRRAARLVRELRDRGCAVVMATHDLDFAEQVADIVTMLFDGEVASSAPTREFFEGNVYYRP